MGDDYSRSYRKPDTVITLHPQVAIDPWNRLAAAVILRATEDLRALYRIPADERTVSHRVERRALERWMLDDDGPCHILAGITEERARRGIAQVKKNPHLTRIGSTGGNRHRDEPILIGKRGARRRQQCPVCGVHFYPKPRYKRPTPVYCSRTCAGIASRNEVEPRACLQCGQPYAPYRRNNLKQKYCSMKCSGLARRKKK